MYCRSCGQQINEGDVFCGNCGTPIEAKKTNLAADIAVGNTDITTSTFLKNIENKQSEKKMSRKKILISLTIGILILLNIGAGTWYFFYKPNDARPKVMVKEKVSTKDEKSIDEIEEIIEASIEENGNLSYASKYLKAILDNSYKNDSSQLVSMKIATADEAAKTYEIELDDFLTTMLDGAYGLSDEEIEQWRYLFADILAGAKYIVGESEEQDDGSYVVKVTYWKMKVYEPAAEAVMELVEEKNQEWETAYENGEELLSDDEMEMWAAMALKDCIEESLKNVTYYEERTFKVKVIQIEENVWSTSTSDMKKLREVLFDTAVLY